MVVDIVDTPYSYYICSIQVKIISETNLNNFSGRHRIVRRKIGGNPP